MRDIGVSTKDALEREAFDMFGEYLNEHWELKKRMVPPSNPDIDRYYKYALKHGALGGKIMGASSDIGFFLFYHAGEDEKRREFEKKMMNLGLQKIDFKFDKEGVTTIFNGGRE